MTTIGPAWMGWQNYNDFSESVKTSMRFVRSPSSERLLDEVRASCTTRKTIIAKGKSFWRARLGCEFDEVTKEEPDITVVYPEERPYGRDAMKPIPNWRGEGRANPRGIPALYLATTRDTALAEVRPWIGAVISVAQLVMERELNVIDCSKYHAPENFLDIFDDQTKSREDGIWMAIDRAFATPVSKEDEAKDYIPTQVLAELFKAEGYDGVVYKSLLSDDGYNVTLFNLDHAKVINASLHRLNSIQFKFSDTSTQVFFG
jgi:RES domain-containing protein